MKFAAIVIAVLAYARRLRIGRRRAAPLTDVERSLIRWEKINAKRIH